MHKLRWVKRKITKTKPRDFIFHSDAPAKTDTHDLILQSREIILEDYNTGHEVVKIFKGFGEWQDVPIVDEE